MAHTIIKKIIDKFWKEDKYFLIFILLFSFLIRVVYIFSIRHSLLFDSPTMDAGFHDEWAKQVARGDFIGYGPYIRSPLYSHLLGLLYAIFGVDYFIVRIFFAILGSISVVLIFKLAKHLFNKPAAIIASFAASLSWTFIYYDGELLTESLAVFVNLLCVFSFIRAFERPTIKKYFLTGLIFGIGALTRDNLLPIIGIVFIWVIYYYRKHAKKALRFAGLFLGGAFLVILPVTVRNLIVVKDFIPISYYTGVNFYIGNNPYSDGRTAIVPGTRADWWGGVEDVQRIAEREIGHRLRPSEVSLFWADKAFGYIRSDFLRFLSRTIKKFFFIFDLNETSNNQNIYFFRKESGFLRLPVFFSSWFFIPLGLLGIYFAAKDRIKSAVPIFVFLGAYCAPLSLFFVYTRLRHPIMSFFIIFSGYMSVRLYSLFISNKRYFMDAIALYLVLFIALAFNSSKPTSLKDGHFTLGNAYMRKQNFEMAKEEFNKALGMGEPYGSRTFSGLGTIAFHEKDYVKSADFFIKAMQAEGRLSGQIDEFLTTSLFIPPLFPIKLIHSDEKVNLEPFGEVFFLIGNIYASWGEYDAAESEYKKSLAFKETPQANVNLGNIVSITKSENPITYYRKAIELDKSFLPAYFNLAQKMKEDGNLKGALSIWKKAATFAKAKEDIGTINKRIKELNVSTIAF